MKENLLLENAKILAECNGISYMELARKIGLNQNYFYAPHNSNGVAIGVVISLAELFDVSIESLLHEDMCKDTLTKEIEKCQRKIIRLEKRLEEIEALKLEDGE